MVIIMAAVFALPAMAGWINQEQQNAAAQPNAFQSTSTMQGSGSAYSATPAALNEDGTASAPSSGPRKAKQDVGLPDIPVIHEDVNPEALVPVGDAVLPLMLMAAAGAGIIALRRRKAAVK